MRWWPLAASVSGAAFVLSLGALALAPSVVKLCASLGGGCAAFDVGARSLVVGSGSFLAASLVAGLYTVLLTRHLDAARRDSRPLVSVHAPRRRH
ncbi:MAG TPA: hypothetical protein VM582_02290 [Candidatus Thermoplasmatota archaeon]|nr:hypothetical protein [Candidatus Thermoplasmatota archaeon]